jgi:hypothetical protein
MSVNAPEGPAHHLSSMFVQRDVYEYAYLRRRRPRVPVFSLTSSANSEGGGGYGGGYATGESVAVVSWELYLTGMAVKALGALQEG